MSHFTKIETQIRNLTMLRRALDDLGYEYEVGEVKVRGFGGQTTLADLVIRQPNGYDIGFRWANGQYEMVADLWGLRVDREKFLHALTQRYAYHTIRAEAEAQGFAVVEEGIQPDGSIKLRVERWR
ncbi:MAG TPA: DUF1257 domain-containing protein [Armatimonadetes bacterium]|nr:DUF1257 domain-containing protein [Armatimonadota bacterium]